jgi:hypothetical protein
MATAAKKRGKKMIDTFVGRERFLSIRVFISK